MHVADSEPADFASSQSGLQGEQEREPMLETSRVEQPVRLGRYVCKGKDLNPSRQGDVTKRERSRRTKSAALDAPVTTTSRGTPWGEFSLYKAFLAACKRARIEGWRFHDLRHYFVTSCFRVGVPAPTVQSLAGHAHLATTQRYAHVDEEDLVEGVRRLGQQSGNEPAAPLDAE